MAVDADGIPLGVITAPANRHDSLLLTEPADNIEKTGLLPEQASVHLDRGYDSDLTRKRLAECGLFGLISEKGKPVPLQATKRPRWNRRTPGTTLTRSSYGVPGGGDGSSTSGAPSRT